VDHMESSQLFLVRTQDGSVYTGTLSTAGTPGERPMKVEVAENLEHKVVLEQPQIIKMGETSDKFWQRFNGEINTGIIYSKGNQSTQYSLSSDVEYPRERWSAGAAYNSTLSSSTGASAATRNQLNFNALHLLRWNNWFYAGLGDFLQSSEQDIRLQATFGGGVGRFLKNTNNATISLTGGFAWQDTNYQSSAIPQGTQAVTSGLIAGEAKFFKFNKTTLDVTGIFLPAISQPGRVHFNMNATYYVKIFSDLTWNVSFYGNWDNRPPSHFSGSDYGTSSGLGWTFGNR
jgi:hypothetical protein